MQKPCEYRLKISSNKVDHGVIIMNSVAPLSEFSTPVRLAKAQPAPQVVEQGDEKNVTKRIFKRKTKVINASQRIESDEQATSFVLEDFDGQHSLIGKEEEGQEGHYIFLVNQGNEFRILLTQSWFKFNPSKTWLSKGHAEEGVDEEHPSSTHAESPVGIEYDDIFDMQSHHDMKLSTAGKQ